MTTEQLIQTLHTLADERGSIAVEAATRAVTADGIRSLISATLVLIVGAIAVALALRCARRVEDAELKDLLKFLTLVIGIGFGVALVVNIHAALILIDPQARAIAILIGMVTP